MKIKHFLAVLLIILILSACAPRQTTVPPTETTAPNPTATHLPTSTPTPPPPTATPTITPPPPPEVLLSADGPWLVNLVDPSRWTCCAGYPTPGEARLINQDGTGYTAILLDACDHVSEFLLEGGNEANRLMQFGNGLYLFRPAEGIGMRIYREEWFGSNCNTYYTGDANGGLLASFYQASEAASPELILFELPGGEVRLRITLIECDENDPTCQERRTSWGKSWHTVQWSPDGRYLVYRAFGAFQEAGASDIYIYDTQTGEVQRLTNGPEWVGEIDWSPDDKTLAFVALQDAASSDVFIYDPQTGDVQRLTNGPEWSGGIDWSPDGSQIIMQEMLIPENRQNPFSVDVYIKAVWSVSISTGKTKFLYTPSESPLPIFIYLWLDNHRFTSYQGILGWEGARDFRFVDTQNGTSRLLFDGQYLSHASFDPIHETFVIFANGDGKYVKGNYLVSLNNGNILYLEEKGPPYLHLSSLNWDENSGLFVSGEPCAESSLDTVASDYWGNLQCIPAPTPEPVVRTSVDGAWTAYVQDGLWLQTGDEPDVQVSQENANEIVWCPDSSCFFFTVQNQDYKWTLYHVSLPDLTVTVAAEEISDLGDFKWLGVE